MIKIFIVDDEAPARVRLSTLLSDIAAECPHELVGQADGAEQALQLIPESGAQLVLLDVQMPGMTGLELAAHLQKCDHPPAVVFVTAFDEYALQAFEVHALDYLVKPVRAQRLAQALKRAAAMLATPAFAARQQEKLQQTSQQLRQARQHFSVQERGRVLLVPVEEVLFLRAEQKYVCLRTKSREYLIEESLVSIEEEMKERFVRVHRNALVARNAIAGVEKGVAEAGEGAGQEAWLVLVRDTAFKLPISRRQWPIIKSLVK
ncbi:LytTR family DNA-binding domain-containing protein [Massilia sp. W12]|uniref:LytR/AlgR family response regulator transcription factor n=1 Tax=Massilia sp. W12 TaxID=3126507 RepID=UPI0030CAAD47